MRVPQIIEIDGRVARDGAVEFYRISVDGAPVDLPLCLYRSVVLLAAWRSDGDGWVNSGDLNADPTYTSVYLHKAMKRMRSQVPKALRFWKFYEVRRPSRRPVQFRFAVPATDIVVKESFSEVPDAWLQRIVAGHVARMMTQKVTEPRQEVNGGSELTSTLGVNSASCPA